jgi:hypothetical protein
MGIASSELFNSSLILIDENIVSQRLNFPIAPKLKAAIVLLRGRRENLKDDLWISQNVLPIVSQRHSSTHDR